MPECRCATRNLSGQEEGFVELEHFDKHFTQNTIRAFLSKIRKLFSPQFCACEFGWICILSLNMPRYTWKWLNKLFWLCQGSEYVWSTYMFGRLLKMNPVLNKPGFWSWHGCICRGWVEFRIYLIMAPNASITPEYAWICLNVPHYALTWLNIPECPWMYEHPWIGLNKLFWLCQGSKYAGAI